MPTLRRVGAVQFPATFVLVREANVISVTAVNIEFSKVCIYSRVVPSDGTKVGVAFPSFARRRTCRREHAESRDTRAEKLGPLATPEGLEPPTLGSEDQCSVQLSYGAA